MKKAIAMSMVVSLLLTLCGCSGNDQEYDIVMITDKGTIDDKSFNQGTYEGVKTYAEQNNKAYTYIKPLEATMQEYGNAIDQAVKKGAKVIVAPGFLFEPAIYKKQDEYKDVKFILIDGFPNNNEKGEAYKEHTAKNTIGIKFREEQVGYLAGYAAVKEKANTQNAQIAFLGGQAVPAVVNYGYGYLQGANDAAKSMNIQVGVKYYYSDGFIATPEAQTLAASWYQHGVSVIFGCGGSLGNSAMVAAEAANPKGSVIGVDVDQSSESKTVIVSARKDLSGVVQKQLKAVFENHFEGGKNVTLGAESDAVDMTMNTSRMQKFTKAEYDMLYQRIKSDAVTIYNHTKTADQDVRDLTFSHLKVDVLSK